MFRNGEALLRARIGAAAVSIAALAGVLGTGSPAQAAPRIVSGQDAPVGIQAACSIGPQSTDGSWAYCTGSSYSFRATVDCYHFGSGISATAYGPWKLAGAGQTSYASCPSTFSRLSWDYEVYI